MRSLCHSGPLVAAAACLLLSSGGAAQQLKDVVVHPLMVPEGGDDASAIVKSADKVWTQLSFTQADPEAVRRFFDKRDVKSCAAAAAPDTCLGELAKASGASAALFVSVTLYRKEWRFHGRVIRPDGSMISSNEQVVARPAGPLHEDAFVKALRDFISGKLSFDAGSVANPPVGPNAEAPKGNGKDRAAGRPEPGPRPLRLVSYGLVGAGVLSVAGGLVLVSQAGQQAASLRATLDGNGRLREDDLAGISQRDELRRKDAMAWVLFGVGGAAIAGGAALFFNSRGEPIQVIALASPGQAGLLACGRF